MNQADQASNQYGFYAVPKALQPKKKYRQTFQEESKYSDEEEEEQNQYELIQKQSENQKQLQRDFYVDEAPYPEFKPKERGLDYGVQIQKHQLFDFDMEVQPLVQILVGRSVVSAINELQEEKESGQREYNLDQYQKKRNAQLMQTQRLQIKHSRKQDEVKRRILQKQTYTKNKKIATEKLIARKNAKHGLLNLRNQLLNQLQQQGFLRQSTYLSLRVQYESWLYEQIKSIVNQHKKIQQTASNIIKQKQKQVKNQHQQYINKENKRRKDILDERERIKKQNQQRKIKKKIRKQRLALNAQRGAKFTQASQLVNKYEPSEKILKAQSITNGLTKKKNTAQTIHITGGLLNYMVALINNSEENHSAQQIQNIIEKVLVELSAKLQIQISSTNMAKIQQARLNMEANPIQFMTHKDIFIKDLVQKISLQISLLQATGISLKSQVHSNILHSLLSIYLNCLPPQKMQGDQVVAAYQANQKDKKRQQLKNKLQFVTIQSSSLNLLKSTENVIRVRFEKIKPQSQSHQQSQLKENQQKPVDLDEWIDIYDGQGWQRQKKQEIKQAPKQNQQAVTYALTGFDNCFVIDQRNLYFLESQLEKLIGVNGGEYMAKYRDRLEHLHNSNDKIPIYDIQLKWE